MSDLAEEEVRVLQLLESKGSLAAMGFPEELRGAVTRLVERGLVWSLDTRGIVHFRVSTEGAARLNAHYTQVTEELKAQGDAALEASDKGELYTLDVYLKSGSKLTLDRVVDMDFTYQGSSLVKVTLSQKTDARQKLMLECLDLEQVEAVVIVQTEDRK